MYGKNASIQHVKWNSLECKCNQIIYIFICHKEVISCSNNFYKLKAVKKGVALFKMASVKKVLKSKGAAKKWLQWYRLIKTIQVNLCCLIPASLRISTKFTWIVLIKFLPSTYTIAAISWPSPLISQLFFILAILNRAASFFTARLFLSILLIFVI